MGEILKDCWAIKACGREKGGPKVADLGQYVASIEGLGHSCWMIAGTLCGGEVQGSVAQKERNCIGCEVYKLYHRTIGPHGEEIRQQFPDEESKYNTMLVERMRQG